MPSTDVVRTPQQVLVANIRSAEFQEQVKHALPGNVTPERFIRVAATALLTNEELAVCEVTSVFGSFLGCAGDGLLPDGREAVIVARNKKGGGKVASYMPMVRGFIKIAGEDGWTLRASVVFSKDFFEYEEGLNPRLVHRPAVFGEHRGEPIGAYAVGVGPNNERLFEVMDKAKIEKRQAKAQTQAVWNEWPEEMWEKTVVRALFKKLPLGDRERAARVIEASEVEPDEAARLLYGAESAGEPYRGTPVASVHADASPAPETPPDQADRVTGRPDAFGVEEDEPAPADLPPAGAVLDLEVESAAQMLMTGTSKKWAGRPIGEILAGEGGLDWALWMFKENQPRRHADHSEHLLYLAAVKVAEARYPELLVKVGVEA